MTCDFYHTFCLFYDLFVCVWVWMWVGLRIVYALIAFQSPGQACLPFFSREASLATVSLTNCHSFDNFFVCATILDPEFDCAINSSHWFTFLASFTNAFDLCFSFFLSWDKRSLLFLLCWETFVQICVGVCLECRSDPFQCAIVAFVRRWRNNPPFSRRQIRTSNLMDGVRTDSIHWQRLSCCRTSCVFSNTCKLSPWRKITLSVCHSIFGSCHRRLACLSCVGCVLSGGPGPLSWSLLNSSWDDQKDIFFGSQSSFFIHSHCTHDRHNHHHPISHSFVITPAMTDAYTWHGVERNFFENE